MPVWPQATAEVEAGLVVVVLVAGGGGALGGGVSGGSGGVVSFWGGGGGRSGGGHVGGFSGAPHFGGGMGGFHSPGPAFSGPRSVVGVGTRGGGVGFGMGRYSPYHSAPSSSVRSIAARSANSPAHVTSPGQVV